MIHKLKIDTYDRDFLEDLLDLADIDYTIRGVSHEGTKYSIKTNKISKFRKILKILSDQSIRFTSDIGDYTDFR